MEQYKLPAECLPNSWTLVQKKLYHLSKNTSLPEIIEDEQEEHTMSMLGIFGARDGVSIGCMEEIKERLNLQTGGVCVIPTPSKERILGAVRSWPGAASLLCELFRVQAGAPNFLRTTI